MESPGEPAITCDWKIHWRPGLPDAKCDNTSYHSTAHRGLALPGQSPTRLFWLSSDRRAYKGEYPGDCAQPGCPQARRIGVSTRTIMRYRKEFSVYTPGPARD